MQDTTTIQAAQQKIREIKMKLLHGANYHECKKEAVPALAILNEEGKRIAKQYNVRHKPLTFTGIMR